MTRSSCLWQPPSKNWQHPHQQPDRAASGGRQRVAAGGKARPNHCSPEHQAARTGDDDDAEIEEAVGTDEANQLVSKPIGDERATDRSELDSVEDQDSNGADPGEHAAAESRERNLDVVRHDE